VADDERVGRRTFELSVLLHADPSEVIDFLTDPSLHRGLHPFLASAVVIDDGTAQEGPWQDWRIEERPMIGPLRYRIRFTARLIRTSESSMATVLRAAPGCWLRSTAVASPGRVHERTEVTAPWLLLGYMTRNAEKAHARTFALLPDALG
jgi:hypothetical protein